MIILMHVLINKKKMLTNILMSILILLFFPDSLLQDNHIIFQKSVDNLR